MEKRTIFRKLTTVAAILLLASGPLPGAATGGSPADAKAKKRAPRAAGKTVALTSLAQEREIAASHSPHGTVGAAKLSAAGLEPTGAGGRTPGVGLCSVPGFDRFCGLPDPWEKPLSNDEILARYRARYGVDPGARPERIGMCCELFGANYDALQHAFQEGLLGSSDRFDGEVTVTEATDLSFLVSRPVRAGSRPLQGNFYCEHWFAPRFPGGLKSGAIAISDTTKPAGLFSSLDNPFWGCPVWFNNTPAATKPSLPAGNAHCYALDLGPGAVITPPPAGGGSWILSEPGTRSTGTVGTEVLSGSEVPCPQAPSP